MVRAQQEFQAVTISTLVTAIQMGTFTIAIARTVTSYFHVAANLEGKTRIVHVHATSNESFSKLWVLIRAVLGMKKQRQEISKSPMRQLGQKSLQILLSVGGEGGGRGGGRSWHFKDFSLAMLNVCSKPICLQNLSVCRIPAAPPGLLNDSDHSTRIGALPLGKEWKTK